MAILAHLNGTLIRVKPTFKANTWKEDAPNGAFFTVNPGEIRRKVFDGDDATQNAIAWIEAAKQQAGH